MASLSIIVVTWNSAATLGACLDSLPADAEVIVVDNASSDDTVRLAKKYANLTLIESPTNLGFGSACNLAAQQAGGDRILLLNPDASLPPGCLDALQEVLDLHPDCGAVGPRILASDASLELSWGQDPSLCTEWARRRQHRSQRVIPPAEKMSVDWISGACMLVRRAAWQAVRGFDSTYFLYFEDLDLCRRMRNLGWRVFYEPRATLIHNRNHSAQQIPAQVEIWYRASQLRFYTKHNSPVQQGMLRMYLAVKYCRRALAGDRAAQHVIGLAFGRA